MKQFKIGNFRIKAEDDLNWIMEQKTDRSKIPPQFAKRLTSKGKIQQNWTLVGYFPSLLAVKQELAEIQAKKCKTFKELEKWVDKINEIK
jgi:hypothetical protein